METDTARSKAVAKGAVLAAAWVNYGSTRLYVRFFARTAMFRNEGNSTWLGMNVFTYTTWLLLLQQASFVLEYFVEKELRIARAHAYDATVASRGKGPEFWQPYVEEWAIPPIDRSKRSLLRQGFLQQSRNPIVRILISKFLLMPLNFIPFLGLIVSAGLSSITMARVLHAPYFIAKKMTPEQEELFIVERLIGYRAFGFASSLLEKLPVVGLVFSISNRIGAAMWAHDLEKQQHAYASGAMKRSKEYISKSTSSEPSDLPEDFSGGFPSKKGPVRVDQAEISNAAGGTVLESDPVPPPLPPRKMQISAPPLPPR
ncbi:hypothetical protein EMMF5_003709 [Cystobasidiomycetes sp. EMM_F5]